MLVKGGPGHHQTAYRLCVMTSWHGHTFHITGPLWRNPWVYSQYKGPVIIVLMIHLLAWITCWAKCWWNETPYRARDVSLIVRAECSIHDDEFKSHNSNHIIANIPDSKIHGANIGPTWVLSAPWWRLQMVTFSALLALCVGNSPVSGEFPSQRPVTRSFDVFFD